MTYIFDMLKDVGCFELLVQRAAGQVCCDYIHFIYSPQLLQRATYIFTFTLSASLCVWRWSSTWNGSIKTTRRKVLAPLFVSECFEKSRRCSKKRHGRSSRNCNPLNLVSPNPNPLPTHPSHVYNNYCYCFFFVVLQKMT